MYVSSWVLEIVAQTIHSSCWTVLLNRQSSPSTRIRCGTLSDTALQIHRSCAADHRLAPYDLF